MMSEEEVLVDVGGIPLKTVENWANNSRRFKEVISDEQRFQEAFASSQEQLKNKGVPMSYIEQIPREVFDETVKTMFTVFFAREAVQGFFNCKAVEKIESETIFNEDWIRNALEEAIRIHMEATIHASVNAMIRSSEMPGIAIVIDGFPDNDADDAEDDSEG